MSTNQWGFPIICDLFLGGLSAGLFFVSSLAALVSSKGKASYTQLAKYGAYLAPWPVMIACTILMFDLGHWWKFYKLYVVLRWTSPMSLGSWLLLSFTLVSLVYCYAWTTRDQRRRLFGWSSFILGAVNHDLSRWRIPLAWVGLVMSVGVGIYTGTLLSVMQSRPFWNTSVVPLMFLFSALSLGCAALLLGLRREEFRGEQQLLTRLNAGFLIVQGLLILPFVVYGQLSVEPVRESMGLILGGPFTTSFWVLFFGVGLLVPLALQIREIARNRTGDGVICSRWTVIAALMILQGGIVLRYVFVYAGQMSVFN